LTSDEDYFWELAESLESDPRVSRSTMMGLPCLRCDGAFFASFDRRTGALVIKLSEDRVDELLAAGRAEAFAPAGRRFRQWAAISAARRRQWPARLAEAHTFVVTG
jgi:hypothetical protein